jgi:hypothetical protein
VGGIGGGGGRQTGRVYAGQQCGKALTMGIRKATGRGCERKAQHQQTSMGCSRQQREALRAGDSGVPLCMSYTVPVSMMLAIIVVVGGGGTTSNTCDKYNHQKQNHRSC